VAIITGTNGSEHINGTQGNDTIFGNGGDDDINAKKGDDIVFGGAGDDTIRGGEGNDQLTGDDGNDSIYGEDGNDTLKGSGGFDMLDGGSGIDKAVFTGSIFEYDFHTMGGYLFVVHNGVGGPGTGADNADALIRIEKLQFNDVTIDLTQNNAPIARDDAAFTDEDAGIYSSGEASVLDNDFDFEGNMSVTPAVIAGAYGTLTMNSDGTYYYELNAGAQVLAQGEAVQDSFSYTVTDGSLSDTANLVITVTGVNDAPVANADTASIGENGAPILISVLANDSDVDHGAVLTLNSASAPSGQGTASVVGNQVRFDPGTDFDDLAAGQTEQVVVSYEIQDEYGATATSTVTITVTGANDGPTAVADTGTTHENAVLTVDVLANDEDVDNGAVLTIVSASVTPGEGSVTIVDNKIRYDPGNDLDYLADGESYVVVVNYTMQDEHGVQSSTTLSITVQGETDGTINGTEGDDVLIGTPDADAIFAFGGNDTVFGQGGDDFIKGGDGNDILNGEAGNDIIQGGNDGDTISGGDGFDNLQGDAGNDTISGGNDGDALSGGDGDDLLSGDSGNDTLSGDDGNDTLSGGAGLDDLNGDAGNDVLAGGGDDDILRGGDGDDSLDGGDGNDVLIDFAGTNSFTGGLGNDQIDAGSADGAQTIDGGDGSDTIRHFYRYNAGTITTGTGSDTIEIAYADQGSAAVTVTDFTAGAGGDIFRLDGDEGSLLGLLTGWDGGSNPFAAGQGFLRLRQDGLDTVLEWDQDGTAGGANWETLAVFQNSDADDFTDANFAPGYHPDGSTPAGATITGTNGSETINDTVNGNAGADLINGGDGNDQLNGQGDDDTINGGNDDDIVAGGGGSDILFGDAGNDIVNGDSGDDTLSGGAGADSLNGGNGDDSLDGGDGDDTLSDVFGTNSFVGGLGNDLIIADSTDGAQTINGGGDSDTIRHYYRHNASTITTGAGSDTIEIAYADQGSAEIVVTDFTTGGGGDIFRLSGDDGALLGLLSGWDGSSNPFGEFLRLQQVGSDVVLQWDQDGDTGGENWETLVLFQNTTTGDFTEANFEPGYDPGGTAPPGETINGTNGDDTLIGTIGGDTINALAGSDSVFGLEGDDFIYGGDGFDNLNGGADDDHIEGGNQDDSISGGEGNDVLLGDSGDDFVFGEDGNDQITGGEGNDSLGGDAGDDHILGGNGNDFLTGGDGADSFAFLSASQGADDISDFVGGTDKIEVSAAGFGGGLSAGGPVTLVSGSTPTASGAGGQFLFDTDDGNLFWDADGSGAGAAVLIATLSNLPSLSASDFTVV
jgi:VCBS repeat-containing protein